MSNEAIWGALDEYFSKAGSDREANIRLARSFINQVGDGFIIGGISWVAESIEKEGLESRKLSMLGTPDLILNLRLFQVAKDNLAHYGDVVSIKGREAGAFLAASIGTAADEDEAALAAYLFANNFVNTLDEVKLTFLRIFIKELFKHTIGTSCRMALAWALYNMGEKREWESFVYDGIVWKKEYGKIIENFETANNPSKSKNEIKSLVCREIALADGAGIRYFPEVSKMGIVEFLALDLASNGKAFATYPGWKRKQRGT